MARPTYPRLVQPGAPVTTALIAVCVLAFLWLEFNGGSTDILVLLRNGAKFTPLIRAGEWWRLFTSMFLHSGALHLAVNSYSLYNLGGLAERLFGRTRFLTIYLLSGLWGAIASALLSDPLAVSVGASGAVFGVAGSLFYFGAAYPRHFAALAGRRFITVVVANLIIGFAAGGIDGVAHAGGLVGGFLISMAIGFPYETHEPHYTWLRAAVALATVAGFILCVAG